MTDKTGHADKPGAGPFDAQYVCGHGIPSGFYTYENQSGTFEAVKISPAGTPDVTVAEPTLLGERLFTIIAALRDKFPSTYVHMLTNGRSFAWPNFTARLAELRHPNFMLGIPLYSDDSRIHDYVVQARDAFDQTVLGQCGVCEQCGGFFKWATKLHSNHIHALPAGKELVGLAQ